MLVSDFEQDLEYFKIDMDIRGLSINTIKLYESVLGYFYKYLKENQLNPTSDDEWLKTFKQYVYHRKNVDGIKKNTIHNIWTIQKAFNKFKVEYWLENIPTPKHDKVLPKIVSDEEYSRIMKGFESVTPRTDEAKKYLMRDRFVILLLYNTGLRISELAKLRVSDIDLDNRILHVNKGKGGKSRTIPLNNTLIREYQEYVEVHAPKQYVIFNKQGNSMSTRMIANIVRQAGMRARLERNITAHQFRHSFATRLVKNGMNIRSVQMLLGHTSLDTTQIYVNLTLNDIQDEFNKIMGE